MDPTLAPGYVPPDNGKTNTVKGHHWAEVQKERAKTRESGNSSSSGENEGSTGSDSSSNSTRGTRPTMQRPATSDGPPISSASRHPRLASWRGSRSALSDGEGIGGPADLEEVPIGVKRQALQLGDYTFPEHRLRTVMNGSP